MPSELNAAYLYAQLEVAEMINYNRLKTWDLYYKGLKELEDKQLIELPIVPDSCTHNAHMFYIKCKNLEERSSLINYLKEEGIYAVFHYVPLHSSEAGLKYGRFHGEDEFTTKESERLVRLPMYFGLKPEETRYIIDKIYNFFVKRS